MDVKPRDFNFEIDDWNNDCITSNILNNEIHQNFLGEGRIYDKRLRLKMMMLMWNLTIYLDDYTVGVNDQLPSRKKLNWLLKSNWQLDENILTMFHAVMVGR